ncbi:hypothetical protein VNI00_014753 [Paramarasmius palmivorus]|uniref:Uncharacterized protein n=1 Tax=Paramarasmius palmivorus TaxID=297713 RepID=A0AAW0BRY9_9AGAR
MERHPKIDAIYERLFCDLKCPVPGCTLPVDIVIFSHSFVRIEAKRFGTHQRNLEIFNDPESISKDLSYTGEAELNRKPPHAIFLTNPKNLELLLRFSHDHSLPDLRLEQDIETVYSFSRYLGKRSPKDSLFTLGWKSDNYQFNGIDEYARRSMSLTYEDAKDVIRSASTGVTYRKNPVVWKEYKDEWDRTVQRYTDVVQNLITSVVLNYDDNAPDVLQLIRRQLESEVTLTSESVTRTFDIIRSEVDLEAARMVLESILEECPVWEQLAIKYKHLDDLS